MLIGNLNGSPASSIIRKCIKSPLSETPPKVTYERKFPGPAGLFPKKQVSGLLCDYLSLLPLDFKK